MNAPQTYDAGVSHQIGRYSDAIRVPAGYDQIVVSGTPGLDENGNIPADFADEARQAWRNPCPASHQTMSLTGVCDNCA